jgi:hypothetical protein
MIKITFLSDFNLPQLILLKNMINFYEKIILMIERLNENDMEA